MNGFSAFGENGGEYETRERAYKEELRKIFEAEVLPRVTRPLTGGRDAVELTSALHRTLTAKLASNENKPQNIITWQIVDRLKPSDEQRSEAIGSALHALLSSVSDKDGALEEFIKRAGSALQNSGASGPFGAARLIGSCALMLQYPAEFLAIQTEVSKPRSSESAHWHKISRAVR